MISVVVVSHDTRDQLRQSLRHLAAVEEEWDELIVVDCASQDGTLEMLAEEFPRARVLALDQNVGFGRANNRGVELAQGDQLLLLNSDAWPEPGTLRALSKSLDEDEGTALVAPRLRYPDGRLQFSWAPATGLWGELLQKIRNRFEDRPRAHQRPPLYLRPVFDQDWFTAACVLLRRRAFDEVGGFDEAFFLYFEDVDLCRRLRLRGWKLTEVPQARAVHVKGGSGSPATIDLEYRRSQLLYYARHRPRWEFLLLRAHLRRRFRRHPDPHQRRHLLALLD